MMRIGWWPGRRRKPNTRGRDNGYSVPLLESLEPRLLLSEVAGFKFDDLNGDGVWDREFTFPASLDVQILASANGGDGSVGTLIHGVGDDDEAGSVIASAGDINGDGLDDIAIGAFDHAANVVSGGDIHIVFGQAKSLGAEFELSSLDGTNGFRIHSDDGGNNSRLRQVVRSAGDVDGDGFDDLIIGRYPVDGKYSVTGSAYVVFGKATGFAASMNLSDLATGDGSDGFVINGVGNVDDAGQAVAGGGDIDGDGFDDLLVSTYSVNYTGVVYAIFGTDAGFNATFDLSDIAGGGGALGLVITGTADYDKAGYSTTLADINGDTFDDIIIGAPQSDVNANNAGAVYVIFGASSFNAANVNLSNIAAGDGSVGMVINGQTADDRVGQTVAAAGDINGDTIDDLLIGAPRANAASGIVYAVFGNAAGFGAQLELSALDAATTGFAITANASGDALGTSLAAVGDINLDGVDDFVIGAPRVIKTGTNTGAAYVIYGDGDGFTAPPVLSDLAGGDATIGIMIQGAQAGDLFARSLAAGDFNADGFQDLYVGAHGTGTTNIGAVSLLYGGPGLGSPAVGSEPPVAGWTIFLDLNNDDIIDAGEQVTLTNSEGLYHFAGVASGAVWVSEVQQAGWQASNPNDGDLLVTLDGVKAVTNLNFGNFQDVTLAGNVFEDMNADGTNQPSDDIALEGWTVYLDFNGNGELSAGEAVTLTDASGDYAFNALSPGTYIIREELQTDWLQRLPGDPDFSYTVNVLSGDTLNNLDFANYRQGTIEGRKYEDLNRDGISDPEDPGLEGWQIFLDLNTDGILDAGEPVTITDADGRYAFTNLDPDTYVVSEVQQSGWVQSGPVGDVYTLTVTSNVTLLDNDFGNYAFITISGTKYEDADGNGFVDAGDAPLGDWTIYLDLDDNGTLDAGEPVTLTDINGEYIFEDVDAGTYTVSEVIPADWRQTLPGGPSFTTTIQLAKGDQAADIDFANYQVVSIAGRKFEDENADGISDAGEPGVPDWTIFLDTDANGLLDTDEPRTLTQADGTYLFADMPPGDYLVAEVQQPGWIQSSPIGDTFSVTLASGQDAVDQDFGNYRPVTITGTKFRDLNGDGRQNLSLTFPANFEVSDLEPATGFTFNGETAGDFTGGTVRIIGDINDDGFDDIAIAAPFADPGSIQNAGEVYIVFGGSDLNLTTVLPSDLNGTNGLVMHGSSGGEFAGQSVSAAGDINGDGIDDIIIGSVGRQPGGLKSGSAFVVYGKSSAWSSSLALSSVDGTTGFVFNGSAAYDQVGYAVSAAGDINGDGFDDVLIGATEYTPLGSRSGSVYLLFGSNGGPGVASMVASDLDGTTGTAIHGVAPGDQLGFSLSAAGDVNGDAVDDMILAAAGPHADGQAPGKAYVIFGSDTGWGSDLELSSVDGTNGFILTGTGSADYTGGSVSGIGDLNGDGFADIAIGAFSADNGQVESGSAFIVFGMRGGFPETMPLSSLDGTNGFRIDGETGSDRLGVSVSGIGDINLDGLNDLIIGARVAGTNEAGAAYVLLGTTASIPAVMNPGSLDGTSGFAVSGIASLDNFGIRVGGWGDVNADGYDDLVIGANLADPTDISSGQAYVVYGGTAIAATATPTEPGISNWTIYLDLNNNQMLDVDEPVTLTGSDGRFEFSQLPPSTYHVREILPAGWVQSFPQTGFYTVSLGVAERADDLVFGNYERVSISGSKFEDLNADTFWERGLGRGLAFEDHLIADNATAARTLAIADIDDDGDLDFIVGEHDAATIAWYQDTDGGGQTFNRIVINGSIGGVEAIAVADLDGDNDLDVAAVSRIGNTVQWFENLDGVGGSFDKHIVATGVTGVSTVAIADVNGDGNLDLLAASFNDGRVIWYDNTNGDGTSFAERVVDTGVNGGRSIYPVDYDQDGDMDFLIGFQIASEVAWYENTNRDGSSFDRHLIGDSAVGVYAVAAVDIDGDGDLDAVAASRFDDSIAWYENEIGNGTQHTEHLITNTANTPFSIATADMDSDGDQDLIAIENATADVVWYDNNGDGSQFTRRFIFGTAEGVRAVAVADIDLDGDIDVATASAGNNDVAWYANLFQGVVEPGIQGWTVYLDLNNNAELDAGDLVTLTDADGAYSFDQLEPGRYTVREVAVDGWRPSIPTSASYTFDLTSGQAPDRADFGNYQVVSVSGTVYEDVDGNGVRESSGRVIPDHINISDLNGINGYRLIGDGDETAGASVTMVGDLNGDGFDDLVIGAPGSDVNGTNAGAAYVVFATGDQVFPDITLSALDGTNGFVIRGEDESDRVGSGLVGDIDFNGDGIDDLVIAGQSAQPGTDLDLGAVYIVFGQPVPVDDVLELSTLSATAGFVIRDISNLSHSPDSVIAVGDINDDSIHDIAIVGEVAGSPVTHVVFGTADSGTGSLNVSSLDGTNGFTITSTGVDTTTPAASSAGDINSDGIDDIAVHNTSGEVHVIFGSADPFTATFELSSPNGASVGFIIASDTASDGFGRSIQRLGDINGDGIGDLAIGAPTDSTAFTNSGATYVIFGVNGVAPDTLTVSDLDGTNGFLIRGTTNDHRLGDLLATSDLNGDGIGDLIVVATGGDTGANNAGEAFVIYGRDSSAPFQAAFELSTLDATTGFQINGTTAGSSFDHLAGGHDINRDGYEDVVIGITGINSDAGETYALLGGPRLSGNAESPDFGLAGWTVFLDLDRNGLISTDDPITVTDANGGFEFQGLTPQEFVVRIVEKTGWVPNVPEAPNPNLKITLASGESNALADFGLYRPGTLSGVSFFDINGDGVWLDGLGDGTTFESNLIADGIQTVTDFTVGDINQDAVPDTIVSAVDGLRWYQSVPAGDGFTFNEHVISTVAATRRSITVVDIDRDGDLDIVAARYDTNELVWHENTVGDGTEFVEHLISTEGVQPVSLLAADIDGDNSRDLVVTFAGDDTVRWFKNTRVLQEQVFTPHFLATVVGVQHIHVTDIDADSDPDIIVTSDDVAETSIRWFENYTGDGSRFDAHPASATTMQITAITATDIDGDADMDIIVSDATNNQTVLFRQIDRTGRQFTQSTILDNTATSLEPVDIDRDGDMDLVVGTGPGGSVLWLENSVGDGRVFLSHQIAADADDLNLIGTGDIDRDGDVEVFVATNNTNGNQVRWFHHATNPDVLADDIEASLTGWTVYIDVNANGQFDEGEPSTIIEDDGGYVFEGLAPGDYIVREVLKPGFRQVHPQAGPHVLSLTSGRHLDQVHFGNQPSTEIHGQAFEDLLGNAANDINDPKFASWTIFIDQNNDGLLDADETFTLTDEFGNYMFNLFPGTYDLRQVVPDPRRQSLPVTDGHEVTVEDFDIVTNVDFGSFLPVTISGVKFLDTDQDGVFDQRQGDGASFVISDIHTATTASRQVLSTDLDGDGLTDLVTLSASGDSITWYENVSSIATRFVQRDVTTTLSGASDIQIADFDSDDDLDVIVADTVDGTILWFENVDGTGTTFTPHTISTAVAGVSGVQAVDIDFDGDVDIFYTAATADTLGWIENHASDPIADQPFAAPAVIKGDLGGAQTLTIVDLDGDWDWDLVATGSTDDSLWWFQNADGFGASFNAHFITDSVQSVTGIKTADIDVDGDTDIVVAASGNDAVYVFRNVTGNGSQFTRTTMLGSFTSPTALDVADVNGDGITDTIVTSSDGTAVWIQASLSPSLSFTRHDIATGLTDPNSLTVTDIDGDQDVDVIVASPSADPLVWLRHSGTDQLETGLSGWCIYLDLNNNGALDPDDPVTVTDSNGEFTFAQIDAGVYIVREWLQTGWRQHAPVHGYHEVAVASGGSVTGVAFGNRPSNELHGRKFEDLDGDGVQDFGEPGIAGWTLFIDSNANSSFDPGEQFTLTDSDGDYLFAVPSGDYIVAEEVVEPWRQSFPVTGVYSVTVTEDETVTGLDFGNYFPATILGFKFEDVDEDAAWDRGQGDGTLFVDRTIIDDVSDIRSFHPVDLDGDGDLDIVANSYGRGQILWFEHHGGQADAFTVHVISDNVRVPGTIAVGDIDGDNDPDIVATSYVDDSLLWFSNNGNATSFTRHFISSDIQAPGSATVADLDKDGDADIIVASVQDDRLVWFQNDATNFTAIEIDSSFSRVSDIQVADLDGDNAPDIIIASEGDNAIVWYDNAAGDASTFISSTITVDAAGVQSVSVGDIDDDGDLDIAAASQEDHRIAWYENITGDASTFEQHILTETAYTARSVDIADIDGDGDLDILAGSDDDQTVAWFENVLGDGVVLVERVVSTLPMGIRQTLAVDINDDGDLDLLTTSSNNSQLILHDHRSLDTEPVLQGWTIYLDLNANAELDADEPFSITQADGSYRFEGLDPGTYFVREILLEGWRQTFPGIGHSVTLQSGQVEAQRNFGNRPLSEVTGRKFEDLNANGTLDSGEPGLEGWTIFVDLDASGTLDANEPVTLTDATGDYSFRLVPGDYTIGEVIPEGWRQSVPATGVYTVTLTPGALKSGQNFGNYQTVSIAGAKFEDINDDAFQQLGLGDGDEFAHTLISTAANRPTDILIADINGDGVLDLVGSSSADDQIAWYEGAIVNEQLTFTHHFISSAADNASAVAVGDIDGDDDLDILSSSVFDDTIAWYENVNGDGSLFTLHTISFRANGAQSVTVGDLDGDNDLDVLSASAFDDKIAWYENTTSDGQNFVEHVISTTADFARQVRVADVDGDNDLDVLSTSDQNRSVIWYENDAGDASSFTPRVITNQLASAHALSTVDIDADGDIDVLATSRTGGQIFLYRNDGQPDPGFTVSTAASGILGTQSIGIADFDGDTHLDLLSANPLNDEVVWLDNVNGDGSLFVPRLVSDTATGASKVAAADLDGDGDADLAVIAELENTVSWFRNVNNDLPEPLLPGWTIYLDLDNSGTLDPDEPVTQTNTEGVYLFQGLDPGTYFVREVLPEGWRQTFPVSGVHQVDLPTSGDTIDGVNFGNRPDADFSGTVFEDFNGDGIQDVGDAVIAGWTIYLDTNANGELDVDEQFTVTNDVGEYAFRVTPGDYLVSPVLPAGWRPSLPIGGVLDLTIAADENLTGQDFAEYQVATIRGFKFEDVNLNGIEDADEPRLNGWTFYLDLNDNSTFDADEPMTVSANLGTFAFTDLDPGTYIIRELPRDQWRQSSPDNANPHMPTVQSADDVDGFGFGNFRTMSILGTKFLDLTNDGLRDLGIGDGSSFTERLFFDQASGATAVIAADLDHDGDLDAIAASLLDNTIAWFENLSGDGRVITRHVITDSLGGVSDLVAVDMDVDGDLDVLAISSSDNRLVWYENTVGDASLFVEHDISTIVRRGQTLNIGDVDGDLDIDILITARTDNKVAWYENLNGDATAFTEHIIDDTITEAWAVASGDLDDDGDLDVIYGSPNDDELGWFENRLDLNEGFVRHVIATDMLGIRSVHVVDFNQDGNPDILAGATDSDVVAWYDNADGDGSTFVKNLVTTNTNEIWSITTADMDLDGDLDVITASRRDDKIAWYENIDGTGVDFTEHIVTTDANGAQDVFVVDFDADGDPDILAASANDNSIRLFENDNVAGVLEPALQGWTIYLDLNENQRIDAGEPVTVTASDGTYQFSDLEPRIYSVREILQFGWRQTVPAAGQHFVDLNESGQVVTGVNFGNRPGSEIHGRVFDDLDADGIKDANEPGIAGWTLFLDDNNNNQLDAGETFTFTDANGDYEFLILPGNYFVAQQPADGWIQSLPLTDNYDFSITVLEIQADADFGNYQLATIEGTKFNDANNNGELDPGLGNGSSFALNEIFAGSSDVRLFVAGDLDGDFDDDLVVYAGVGNALTWYDNTTGDATAFNPNTLIAGTDHVVHQLVLGDMDGDNDLDIVANVSDSIQTDVINTIWYENLNGDGSQFIEHLVSFSQSLPNALTLADIDGDQSLDILPTLNDRVMYFRNTNGDGSVFDIQPIFTGVNVFQALQAADMDGDGDTDILGGGNLTWFRNNGDGTAFTAELIATDALSGGVLLPTDLDNDGDTDVVAWSGSGGLFAWYENVNGDATSFTRHDVIDDSSYSFDHVDIADIDSDSSPDIVALGTDLTWFTLGSDLQLPLVGHQIVQGNINNLPGDGLVIADIDSDGDNDIATVIPTTGATAWYENENVVPADPTLDGWTIYLDQNNNNELDNGELVTATNADGTFTFTGLKPGDYVVREVLQPGWQQTFPAGGEYPFTLISGQIESNINFLNYEPPAEIRGRVYEDIRGTGFEDPGDPRIEGWTVFLDANANGSLDAGERFTVTDASGEFVLADLPSGEHNVTQIPFAGWQTNTPVDGTHTLTLIGGQLEADVNFGAFETATATGYKFEDMNSNGVEDPGEQLIVGWRFYIDSNDNDTFDAGETAVFTGGDGRFAFRDLAPGTYTIREILQPGWVLTFPLGGEYTFTVNSGDVEEDIIFGNQPPGQIQGRKFEDLNANGVEDPGEPGVAGWTIFLDDNGNGVLDAGEVSTATNFNGGYSFVVLPGSYNVVEAQVGGWIQSSPATGSYALDIAIGQTVAGISFGNYRLASINGFKFNDVNANGIWDRALGDGGLFTENIVTTGADSARSVYAADMDRDGDLDIVAASFRDDRVSWYENAATDGSVMIEHAVATDVDEATSVIVVDMDGDDDPDIVVTSRAGDRVVWFENTDGVGGSFVEHLITLTADSPEFAYPGDIDGDGDMDVVVASYRDNTIAWYSNDDGQGQSFTKRVVSNSFVGAASVHVIDLDGDQDLDIVAAATGDGDIAWFENVSVTGLAFTEHLIDPFANGAIDVDVADMDGDGDLDVIGASIDDGRISWYENGNAFARHDISNNVPEVYAISVADIDRDGDQDVVAALSDADSVIWFRSNNDGSTFFQLTVATSANAVRSVFAADMDGDGDPDVLAASSLDDKIAWHRNENTGTVEPTLAQWTVYLDLNDNGEPDFGEPITSTNVNGAYRFSDLVPGDYVVREIQQPEWLRTFPTEDAQRVTVVSNQTLRDVDFGNHRPEPAQITGTLFHDLNEDGRLNSGELGVAGWTIHLDTNDNGVIDANDILTQTESGGSFSFTRLLPGRYIMSQVDRGGWQRTFPNADYVIQLTAGQTLGNQSFAVRNDAPIGITLSPNTIGELTAPGSVIGTLVGDEPASGVGDTHVFELLDDAGGRFQLTGDTLSLAPTADPLNFESLSSYEVTIRVTDTAGQSTVRDVTINVGDENEAPTAITIDANTVNEHAADGTVIGTISVVDPDQQDTHTLQLVGDAGGRFTLEGSELQVAGTTLLDFEAGQRHTLSVQATDSGGLTFTELITVVLLDQNDLPTGLSIFPSTVSESLPANAQVGVISVDDQDANDVHALVLNDNDNGRFILVGDSLRLAPDAQLDFETTPRHHVTITATDQFGQPVTQTLTINVSNAIETNFFPPSDIRLSSSVIDEHAPDGTVIGTLSAVDPDRGDTFTFSLVDDAGGVFAINGSNLTVRDSDLLDFEANQGSITFEASVFDGKHVVERPLTVTLFDVNEPPTDITIDNSTIPGNAADSSVVGRLTAVDVDGLDAHVFELLSDAGGRFTLLQDNIIVAPGSPLSGTDGDQVVRVRATDRFGISVTRDLTIRVASESIPMANRQPVSFTNQDLTPITIKLTGPGIGEVRRFNGTDAVEIVLNGTTDRSSLTVKSKRNRPVDIRRISINGSIKSISAKSTILEGELIATGTVTKMQFDAIRDSQISIGRSTLKRKLSIQADEIIGVALESGIPVQRINAPFWSDSTVVQSSITAPSLGNINMRGNFDVDLALDGSDGSRLTLGNVRLSGSLPPATWTVTGNAGQIRVAEITQDWQLQVTGNIAGLRLGDVQSAFVAATGSIGTVSVVQWIEGSIEADRIRSITASGDRRRNLAGDWAADIDLLAFGGTSLNSMKINGLFGSNDPTRRVSLNANGDVKRVTVGGMANADVYVGVDQNVGALPEPDTDFVNLVSSIRSFQVRGLRDRLFSFENANVAAASIRSVTLADIDYQNAGASFGVASRSLSSYIEKQGGRVVARWRGRPGSIPPITSPDLEVRVV